MIDEWHRRLAAQYLPEGAHGLLDASSEELTATADGAAAVMARFQEAKFQATSEDLSVTVTIDGTGVVDSVALDTRVVAALDAVTLGAAIVETYRKAGEASRTELMAQLSPFSRPPARDGAGSESPAARVQRAMADVARIRARLGRT